MSGNWAKANYGEKTAGFIRVFFIVLAVLSATVAPMAAARPEAASSTVSDQTLDAWVARKKAIGSNAFEQADNLIDAILLNRLRGGISNLPVYSAALLAESVQAHSGGNKGAAPKLLDQAKYLAPDFYRPYLVEAGNILSEGSVLEAVGLCYFALSKKYGAFQTAYPSAFNITTVLLGVYYWLVVVFAAILLARYSKLAAHDLQERIAGFDRRMSLIMTAVLALFPVAFVPSIVLYSFILIILLWIYTNLREKIIGAALVLVLFSTPFPFRLIGNGLAATSEPRFRAILHVREGVWGAAEIGCLNEALGSSLTAQERENTILSLAKAYGYSGQYEKAIALLAGFKSADNEVGAAAEVLKGNIYFHWEKYSEALKCYENAAKLNPNDPIVHFNMASALSRPEAVTVSADNVDRADKEMQKVKKKYSQTLDMWTRYQELDPGRFVADEQLPIKCLWKDMWANSDTRAFQRDSIFRSFSGGIPLNAVPIIALTLLALMGALTFAERLIPRARSCRMCGKAFCPKCQTAVKDNTICARCWNVFETRTGIDPRAREKARAEIRSKSDRAALAAEIISIVLPGSGHLLLGKTLRGVVFTTASLLFYFGLAYRNGVLRSEWLAPVQTGFVWLGVVVFLYLVYVGLIVWRVSRRE